MIAKPLPKTTAKPLSRLVLPVTRPVENDTTRPQRRFPSRQLFGSTREVVIEHNGQEYRLRQTRHGKLILNK